LKIDSSQSGFAEPVSRELAGVLLRRDFGSLLPVDIVPDDRSDLHSAGFAAPEMRIGRNARLLTARAKPTADFDRGRLPAGHTNTQVRMACTGYTIQFLFGLHATALSSHPPALGSIPAKASCTARH
jgi:hypothetical protein